MEDYEGCKIDESFYWIRSSQISWQFHLFLTWNGRQNEIRLSVFPVCTTTRPFLSIEPPAPFNVLSLQSFSNAAESLQQFFSWNMNLMLSDCSNWDISVPVNLLGHITKKIQQCHRNKAARSVTTSYRCKGRSMPVAMPVQCSAMKLGIQKYR